MIIAQSFFSNFISRSFIDFKFYINPTIHFELLYLVQLMEPSSYYAYEYPMVLEQFTELTIPSLWTCLCTVVKKSIVHICVS